ncbi:MAG: phenylalanine--tRNA ligase subunit beta [Peptoniphilus sp.]|uniref:phenylalanine--tRNA ligase subunit beta n=1 Tax=Peptoniphilus sp. TaxID=1971214 RepID=UPI002A74E00C|nr:phenylalanine--tRNA ligase subunit beta [Peptoniphilus sp.]MDY2986789.1 phenylalanine--tRNA ligase subunit beta [Peptoniphilus sp.]
MFLPVKWLSDYIDIDLDIKKVADELSLTGSHVESIVNRAENLSKVVVGKILKIEKHPDADKLVVCQLDVKDEIIQIVTGAQNVFEGAVVPVALSGANLAGGVKIEKGELRGVESNGMLCSLEELGYDQSVISKEAKDGIYIFDEQTEIGISAIEALGLDGEIIEFEITPNRPDCLSIIGMARETSATFDIPLKLEKPQIKNEVEDISEYFESVTIETENCKRFYAKVLKDVEIKPSPLWLQNHLVAAGVRPINNIVDLTNFVMLEYGQPLHAYDLDDLKSKKIVVRQAKDDEILKTLDGEDRTLKSEDIVITDGEKAIGLAGIMGGFYSEIKPTTKRVLLEGANFDKASIRKTSKRLGLRSEASSRFEKGVDITSAKLAVQRVCELAEEIGFANVIAGEFDIYPEKVEEKKIKLRTSKVNKLIGMEFTTEEVSKILNRLFIETEVEGEELTATIPTFRLDLEIEEDLIEEIARIYGYHNIKAKPLEGSLSVGGRSELRLLERRVKNVLLSLGFNEFMTYSFVSPKNFDKLNLHEEDELRNVVKIINPLGEEYSIMRTTLTSNMMEVLSYNAHRGNLNVAGFEFGNTFIPKEGQELPTEVTKLSIGFYDLGDFYFLKEVIRRALWQIGIEKFELKRAKTEFLHPGVSAELIVEGESIGFFGEVHPIVLENYDIKKKCYVAELDFYKLLNFTKENYLFKEIPKYPSVKRDLAFIMDNEVPAYEIEKIARENGSDLLEEFKVFDIYRSETLGADKKSIAFSLIFRSLDKTLVETEVSEITDKIIKSIEDKFGATLRA